MLKLIAGNVARVYFFHLLNMTQIIDSKQALRAFKMEKTY